MKPNRYTMNYLPTKRLGSQTMRLLVAAAPEAVEWANGMGRTPLDIAGASHTPVPRDDRAVSWGEASALERPSPFPLP